MTRVIGSEFLGACYVKKDEVECYYLSIFPLTIRASLFHENKCITFGIGIFKYELSISLSINP